MRGQTEKALRIHLGLVLAEAICVSAFVIELNRARSGNSLSWAYVFEWPVLGAYAIYVWRKLLAPESPAAAPSSPGEVLALDTYNRYLQDVHRGDAPPPTDE